MKLSGKPFFLLLCLLTLVAVQYAHASHQVEVVRIYGADRFETAVRVYERFFSEKKPRIFILAAGYGPDRMSWSPDAVCAAPLASVLDAPLFLTRRDSIDPVTLSAIANGGFEMGIIVGGAGAVSETVVSQILRTGVKLRRLGGVDRYHTSALVAQEMKMVLSRNPELCFIATGENFPDAVASGFLAGRLEAPVLLTRRSSVPFAVKAALNSLNIQKCLIAGGEAAVSRAVENTLPSPVRIAGRDRYETSAKLVRLAVEEFGLSTDTVFLATGETFSDALVASPAASRSSSCVVLIAPDQERQAASLELLYSFLNPLRIYLIGGIKAGI